MNTLIRRTFFSLCLLGVLLLATGHAICDVIALHDHELSQCINAAVDKCARVYREGSHLLEECVKGEAITDCLWISARIIDLCNAHSRRCKKICAQVLSAV